MDSLRFDALTRRLASRGSRRGLVAGIAGIFAGATLADDAEAKKRQPRCLKDGTRCIAHSGGKGDHCRRCCSGFSQPRKESGGRRCVCAPVGETCSKHNQCCTGKCESGTCAPCKPGFKACEGGCIPEADCCGGCAENEVCESDVCVCPPDGECAEDELCGGATCGCMPDPGDCLRPGTPCAGGACISTCCNGQAYSDGGSFYCGNARPGDVCAADIPCEQQGTNNECRCNRCCTKSGVGATRGCATCCSGQCQPASTICL